MLCYPARLIQEPDGGFTATFRDIPEAITCGEDRAHTLLMAEDCLDVALSFYVDDRGDLPKATKARKGEVMVSPSLPYSLKFSLYQAMRDDQVSAAELARRLDTDHKAVSARLLNPRNKTSITQLAAAFRALGRKVEVGLTAT